jgi:hypothetical protein
VSRRLWIIATLLAACGESSRERACSPELGEGSGCGEGEHCIVDEDGIPECADDPGEAGRPLGAVCGAKNDCGGVGVGCLALYGVPRCLPFCGPDPDRFDPESQCVVASADGGEPLRGRCLGVLPDRPDIGACVFECNPADPVPPEGNDDPAVVLAHCPAGASACAIPFDLAFPVCSGDVGEPGDLLRAGGPQAPCPPGRVCVTSGAGGRCRAPAGIDDACAAPEERAQPIPGVVGVKYCAPCMELGPSADGSLIAACYAAEDGNAAVARCEAEGGRLAELDRQDTERLVALLDGVPAELKGKPLWVSGVASPADGATPAQGCGLLVRLPLEGTITFVDRPDCAGTAHALCAL